MLFQRQSGDDFNEKGKRFNFQDTAKIDITESDGPFASRKGYPRMPWDAMDVAHDPSELWSVPGQTVEETLLKNLNSLEVIS